jgi:energy-coupling factor transport system permease protein
MVALAFLIVEPVFRLIGLAASVLALGSVKGPAAALRGNWWVFAVLVVVTAFNTLFNANGLTVLFTIEVLGFVSPVCVESLLYGLSSGMMLASVLLWFAVYSSLMPISGFLALVGRFAPTAALLLARITVFVPELVAHARHIDMANRAFAGSQRAHTGQAPPLRFAVQTISQLMEWAMEKSLITADSMRARGYGAGRRSSYRSMRLMPRDAAALAALLALGALGAAGELAAIQGFSFYPRLHGLSPWWAYLPYAALCVAPFVMQACESLAWRLSEVG